MTMGKILRFVLFVLVGGIGYLFFVREETPFAGLADKQQDGRDFVSRDNDARRGDDPTYSQEMRQNSAIVLETQRKQMELEQQLAGEHGEAVQQEVDARMEKINETLQGLQQQQAENQAASQARISELEQKLAEAQAATAATPPDAIDALKQGQGTSTTPPLPDVYGSGSITLPYQGMSGGESAASATSRIPRAPVATAANSGSGDFIDSLQDGFRSLTGVVPDRDPNVPRGNLPQPGARRQQEGWQTVFPVYTLPPNAVLSNALLVTPIIGRVPLPNRNGRVEDPFFFKVEIGGANLAANGHQIPGVAKMIASGYATGIRDQQCVRGYIDSLTFIFIDGRIVNQGKASGEGASSGDVLGYLSDPWGKPCIRGRYINNADSYLRSRGTAAFIEAAAEALSQGQVNYKQNSDGNYSAALSGDVWKFVFGRGVSGTAAEFAQYVKERTADTFDVVYVEQGKPVQIMLDKMIPIDYDAKARKVNYYREPKIKRRYD